MRKTLVFGAAGLCALTLAAAPAGATQSSYTLSCGVHFDGTEWVVHGIATTYEPGTDYVWFTAYRGKNSLGAAGYPLVEEPLSGNEVTWRIQDKPNKLTFTFQQGGDEGTPIGSGTVRCTNDG